MKFKTGLMLAFASVLASGCSTSVVPDKPDEENSGGEDREITMNVRVMQNGYTRASEDEDGISSLFLAFYAINGGNIEFISLKEATANGNSYKVQVSITDKIPDIVVAFANISDQDAMKKAIGLMPATVSSLTDASNNLVMSSARYYDSEQNSRKDVYYSVITDQNIKGTSPVDIHLERVAAKVTVANNVTKTSFTALDPDGNARELTFNLTGWNLTATDKSSYLLKNNGGLSYSGMEAELGLNGVSSAWNWNDASRCSLNWAHSVNWGLAASDFPAMGTESAESATKHVMFSEVTNGFGESAYVHETTRPSSLFSTPNAKPMLVLAGKYVVPTETSQKSTSEENAYKTNVYRRGNYVISHKELVNYFFNKQQEIYIKDDRKTLVDSENTLDFIINHNNFVITSPEDVPKNLVTLQTGSEISSIGLYYNKDGVLFNELSKEGLDKVNSNLREQCGLWEIYQDGNCVFLIPVEHLGKNTDAAGERTGSYGIVRNHHYKININNIAGFGYGVPGSGTYIGEMVHQDDVPDASGVTYNVSVNAWNEVTQDVD